MVDATVFSEKIRRPRAAGLIRERLVRPFLDAGVPALGLVTAPAGSGKTTLLAHVAAGATTPVGWYTVSADDRSEETFARHLARSWSDAVHRPDPAPHDVRAFARHLDTLPSPACLLVVDDVHEIAGTPVETALATFLTLRPHTVRVVLGSRRIPDVNVPRLQVSGEIHVVDGNDLRFRFWEVEELFAAVHGEPLPPESAAELTRRTGGWAAGLRMFQFANSGRPVASRRRAVTDLGSSSRWLTAYLARNVLAELGPARREFLLRTCALGMMTGALCDDLLQTTGSAAMLADLEQLQLFTTRSDDGLSYRYHEILRRHLESTFHAEHGEAATRAWYVRAGAVLEHAGEIDQAVHAYARAEDWPAATRLVRGRGDGAAGVAVDDLLAAHLPDSDPWLALADARRRVRRGDLDGALAAFDRAEHLTDEAPFRVRCRREAAAVRRWRPGEPSGRVAAEPGPGHREWIDLVRDSTVRRMSPANRAVASVHHATLDECLGEGFAALFGDDPGRAQAWWRRVVEAEDAPPLPSLVAGLGLVTAGLVTGARPHPTDELERLERMADEHGLPWLARVGRGLLAAVLARPPAPDWRQESVEGLVAACDRDGDAWGAAVVEAVWEIVARAAADSARRERVAARFAALAAPVVQEWVLRWADAAVASQQTPTASTVPERGSSVSVRTFGGLRLEIDGDEVDLGGLRPRARSLLRLLALSPGHQRHRDWLVDVLWPDATAAVGTRRLQVAVSSVRQALGDPSHGVGIRRSGDAYALALPQGARVDVARFEDLVRDAARIRAGDPASTADLLAAALEVCSDDLLPEEGELAPVVAERERLRLVAAGAAVELAKARQDQGSAALAVAAARRATELDPYSDTGWALLAGLHEGDGDHGAALRVHQRHARMRQELDDGVDTSPPAAASGGVERS